MPGSGAPPPITALQLLVGGERASAEALAATLPGASSAGRGRTGPNSCGPGSESAAAMPVAAYGPGVVSTARLAGIHTEPATAALGGTAAASTRAAPGAAAPAALGWPGGADSRAAPGPPAAAAAAAAAATDEGPQPGQDWVDPRVLAAGVAALNKAPVARSSADITSILTLVAGVHFFRDLAVEVRAQLCRAMRLETLEANRIVFSEGDPGDKFYVVLHGGVSVRRKPDNPAAGRRQLEAAASMMHGTGGTGTARASVLATSRSGSNTSRSTLLPRGALGASGAGASPTPATLASLQAPGLQLGGKRELTRSGSIVSVTPSHAGGPAAAAGVGRSAAGTAAPSPNPPASSGASSTAAAAAGLPADSDAALSIILAGVVLARIKAGQGFGEVALLSKASRPRMATIVTDVPTLLLVIQKEDYLRTIRTVHERAARDKVSVLCRVPELRDCSLAQLREMAAFLSRQVLPAGTLLSSPDPAQNEVSFSRRAGNGSGSLFIVMEGHVEMVPPAQLADAIAACARAGAGGLGAMGTAGSGAGSSSGQALMTLPTALLDARPAGTPRAGGSPIGTAPAGRGPPPRAASLGPGAFFGDHALGFAHWPDHAALVRSESAAVLLLTGPDLVRHVSSAARAAMAKQWHGRVAASSVAGEMSVAWAVYKKALVEEVLYQKGAQRAAAGAAAPFSGGGRPGKEAAAPAWGRGGRKPRAGTAAAADRTMRDGSSSAPAGHSAPRTPEPRGSPASTGSRTPASSKSGGSGGASPLAAAAAVAGSVSAGSTLRITMASLGLDLGEIRLPRVGLARPRSLRDLAPGLGRTVGPGGRPSPLLPISDGCETPSDSSSDEAGSSCGGGLSRSPASTLDFRSASERGAGDSGSPARRGRGGAAGARGRSNSPRGLPATNSEAASAVETSFEHVRQLARRLPASMDRYVDYLPDAAVLVAKLAPIGEAAKEPFLDAGLLDAIQDAWARLAARRGLLSLRHHHSVFVLIAAAEPPAPPREPGKPAGKPLRPPGAAAAAAALASAAIAMKAALAELLARCQWELRTKGRAAKVDGVWRVLCTPRGGYTPPPAAAAVPGPAAISNTAASAPSAPAHDEPGGGPSVVPELVLCAGLAQGDVFLERAAGGEFVVDVYGRGRDHAWSLAAAAAAASTAPMRHSLLGTLAVNRATGAAAAGLGRHELLVSSGLRQLLVAAGDRFELAATSAAAESLPRLKRASVAGAAMPLARSSLLGSLLGGEQIWALTAERRRPGYQARALDDASAAGVSAPAGSRSLEPPARGPAPWSRGDHDAARGAAAHAARSGREALSQSLPSATQPLATDDDDYSDADGHAALEEDDEAARAFHLSLLYRRWPHGGGAAAAGAAAGAGNRDIRVIADIDAGPAGDRDGRGPTPATPVVPPTALRGRRLGADRVSDAAASGGGDPIAVADSEVARITGMIATGGLGAARVSTIVPRLPLGGGSGGGPMGLSRLPSRMASPAVPLSRTGSSAGQPARPLVPGASWGALALAPGAAWSASAASRDPFARGPLAPDSALFRFMAKRAAADQEPPSNPAAAAAEPADRARDPSADHRGEPPAAAARLAVHMHAATAAAPLRELISGPSWKAAAPAGPPPPPPKTFAEIHGLIMKTQGTRPADDPTKSQPLGGPEKAPAPSADHELPASTPPPARRLITVAPPRPHSPCSLLLSTASSPAQEPLGVGALRSAHAARLSRQSAPDVALPLRPPGNPSPSSPAPPATPSPVAGRRSPGSLPLHSSPALGHGERPPLDLTPAKQKLSQHWQSAAQRVLASLKRRPLHGAAGASGTGALELLPFAGPSMTYGPKAGPAFVAVAEEESE